VGSFCYNKFQKHKKAKELILSLSHRSLNLYLANCDDHYMQEVIEVLGADNILNIL
jgi:hypothetical protein